MNEKNKLTFRHMTQKEILLRDKLQSQQLQNQAPLHQLLASTLTIMTRQYVGNEKRN